MGWGFGNIANNISGMFKEDPAKVAAQDFLKSTVFKGQIGFSAVEKFSDDNVKNSLDKFFTARFKDVPADKMPKSFTEDDKKAFVKELMGASFDKAPNMAKEYLLEKVEKSLDKYEEGWLKKTGRWVKDTAVPAVNSAATTVVSLTPVVGQVYELAGWGAGTILEKNPGAKDIPLLGTMLKTTAANGLNVTEHREAATKAIVGFGTYVANNPGRAGSLAVQGVANAVVSTGGFFWDAGRFATYDCIGKGIIGNAAIGLYNLGADKEGKAEYLGTGKFFRHSEWMNEHTQFVDRIQPVNKDGTKNENANYERVLVYGPQAVFEVGAVVVTSALTAGATGAIWAAARGTRAVAVAVETAEAVEVAAHTTKTVAQTSAQITAQTSAQTAAQTAAETAANATKTLAQVSGEAAEHTGKTLAQVSQTTGGAATQTAAETAANATKTLAQTSGEAAEHTSKTLTQVSGQTTGGATAQSTTAATQTTGGATAQSSTQTGAWGTAQRLGTVDQVRKVEAVADANALLSKVDKAQEALDRAKAILASAREAGEAQRAGTASTTLTKAEIKAQEAVTKATDNLTKATEKAYQPKLALEMNKVKASGATTQDYVQSTARALEKAKAELEAARAAGQSDAKITKLTDKVTKLEGDIAKKSAEAERVGARVAGTSDVINFGNITYGQNILETSRIWAHQGIRMSDPLRDGAVGKVLNAAGAGMSFGVGVYSDQKNASAEITKADAARKELRKMSDDGSDIGSLSTRQDELANQAAQKLSFDPNDGKTTSPSPSEQESAAPANLSPDFNANGANGTPASENSGGQSNEFNNRASPSGIVIAIDPSLIEAMHRNQGASPSSSAPASSASKP